VKCVRTVLGSTSKTSATASAVQPVASNTTALDTAGLAFVSGAAMCLTQLGELVR